MKFVFTDSRHNFFHWLIVVLIKLGEFLISSIVSVCAFAFGFSLASNTISHFLPEIWVEVINYYSAQLPYFQKISGSMFKTLNHWYQEAPVWWGMVVGIPLILVGISFFFIFFFNLYYSIFSTQYNHTHCPFCKRALKIKLNHPY